jgi:outer membrane receptor for ferrienterochelin and colicin
VPPAGETFPLKRFPDTKESATALYVQDEFIVGDWSVTPGVRADSFKIDAAQAGFPVPAVSLSGSAVSPKVGVIYRASPRWTVFGNYASGFRAPNAGQVNGFFQNLAGGYRTVPNPNLKPEKSRNVEFGVRGRLDQLSFDTAVFYGRFKDLIQDGATVSGTFGNPANPAVIQSINIDNATISGFEIKGAMNWGKVGNGQLSTPFAYGYTRGTVKNTGKPLDTIDPAKLVVGVKYETAMGCAPGCEPPFRQKVQRHQRADHCRRATCGARGDPAIRRTFRDHAGPDRPVAHQQDPARERRHHQPDGQEVLELVGCARCGGQLLLPRRLQPAGPLFQRLAGRRFLMPS